MGCSSSFLISFGRVDKRHPPAYSPWKERFPARLLSHLVRIPRVLSASNGSIGSSALGSEVEWSETSTETRPV